MSEMPVIEMDLFAWRGYSAYEIAVQNGFEGTEEEWLESLKGKPGLDGNTVTVNYKSAVDGNINVRGSDIYWRPGDNRILADVVDGKVDSASIVDALDSDDATAVLSAAQGKILNGKTKTYLRTAVLIAGDWIPVESIEGNHYTQTVNVANMTANTSETSAIVSPTDRANTEAYAEFEIMPISQGDGTLTFSALSLPDKDVTVGVMVVIQGVGTVV